MILLKKLKNILNSFNYIKTYHISAYSAKSSYFLIMSLIPMIILILYIMHLLNLFGIYDSKVFNSKIFILSNKIFNKTNTNNGIIDISNIFFAIFFSAWTGGKAFSSLSEAFNTIIHNKESKNYFTKRLKGGFVSIIFAFIIAILVITVFFSENIIVNILHISVSKNIIYIVRLICLSFCTFLIILLSYIFLPDWNEKSIIKIKVPIKVVLRYSCISTLVVCSLMFIFSIYVSLKFKYKLNYNIFTVIIAFMLWLYFSLYDIILTFVFLKQNWKK